MTSRYPSRLQSSTFLTIKKIQYSKRALPKKLLSFSYSTIIQRALDLTNRKTKSRKESLNLKLVGANTVHVANSYEVPYYLNTIRYLQVLEQVFLNYIKTMMIIATIFKQSKYYPNP